MKVIDIYDKIAKGEKIPTFIISDDRYKYFMKDGFLYYNKLGYEEEEVEWSVYKDWLNREITIVEDEFIDIEEITLNGEKLGYGGLSEWLGSKQTDNEVKLCSSIECLGVTLNDLIKNQKKIIQALKENK